MYDSLYDWFVECVGGIGFGIGVAFVFLANFFVEIDWVLHFKSLVY